MYVCISTFFSPIVERIWKIFFALYFCLITKKFIANETLKLSIFNCFVLISIQFNYIKLYALHMTTHFHLKQIHSIKKNWNFLKHSFVSYILSDIRDYLTTTNLHYNIHNFFTFRNIIFLNNFSLFPLLSLISAFSLFLLYSCDL